MTELFPLVSIIIPAYNVEQYIESCILSILNQSYANIEILICDDGSTDNSKEIVLSIKDSRIRFLQNPKNKGVVYTRNLLLREANGVYIMLQDADDRSHPERINKQFNFLLKNPEFKACGTQFVKCYKNKTISRSCLPSEYQTIKESIPEQYHFLPGSLFFEASILKKIGYYNPFFANDGNEDLYWISKIIINYPYKNLNEHLYYYELNIASLTKFQVSNSRKHYIHSVTASLLNSYKLRGTNALEENNEQELQKLERVMESKEGILTPFDLIEKQIGQLLFFELHGQALKILLLKSFKDVSFKERATLFLYVLKKRLWK